MYSCAHYWFLKAQRKGASSFDRPPSSGRLGLCNLRITYVAIVYEKLDAAVCSSDQGRDLDIQMCSQGYEYCCQDCGSTPVHVDEPYAGRLLMIFIAPMQSFVNFTVQDESSGPLFFCHNLKSF